MSRVLKGLPLLPLLGVQAVTHPVLLLLVHLIVPILLSLESSWVKLAVLRIRDILVRIRGSVPLTHGSGSCYIRHWPLRRQQKLFLLITFWRFFKDKTSYLIKNSQNSKNQGFSYYFCLMIEGSGSVPLTNGSGSRRPKTHTDPDPQHCKFRQMF